MSIASASTRHVATASVALLLGLTAVFAASGLHAQAQTAATRPAPTAATLPIRRVVLYKSGVGYFEHLGRVRGNGAVSIDFTSAQLDDVLTSLTTLDLDGGRIASVSYNTDASLDRQIGALRVPIGEQATRAQLLNALRGARVDIAGGTGRVTGRLLGVERVDRGRAGQPVEVDAVSIVTDQGAITTVPLDAGVSVRLADKDVGQDVSRYLSLLAAQRNQDLRRMTIATSGTGDRDLFVSYVSEAPVWKASYRLILSSGTGGRAPQLQGWAVVDNTSGADWNDVELSLVAGAPQSFVQSLSRPYYVQRPVVPMPDRVLSSPQTHQSALAEAGLGVVAGTVTDARGQFIPGATVTVTRNGVRAGAVVTDANGRYRVPSLVPGAYDISVVLAGFNTVSRSLTVSGGMESVLNIALAAGSSAENMSVKAEAAISAVSGESNFAVAGGAGRGRGGGGRGGAGPATRVETVQLAQQAEADTSAVGDLFEYTLRDPITIRKDESALVPIIAHDVQAEKVSLWNASSNAARPLRAVWLNNTTGVTLDGGSFTVVDGQTFAGEGLMDPLRAGERRLLSYASDLALTVTATGQSEPTRVSRVQVTRGLVVQQTEERTTRTYTARNEDAEARTLVIEHPVRTGWTVAGDVAPFETTPAWYRFRITIAPKTTATFTVSESRPGQTQYAVNAVTDDQVALLVRNQSITPAVEAALRGVLARKAALAAISTDLETHQAQIAAITEDQQRMRENMQSLKGSREEKQLLQRYVQQLNDEETRLGTLRAEVGRLTTDRQRAQTDLSEFIASLTL